MNARSLDLLPRALQGGQKEAVTMENVNGTVATQVPQSVPMQVAPQAVPPPAQQNQLAGIPLSQEQVSELRQFVRHEAAQVYKEMQRPLISGTKWEQRLKVGGIVLVGAGVGVGTTLAVQKYRARKTAK